MTTRIDIGGGRVWELRQSPLGWMEMPPGKSATTIWPDDVVDGRTIRLLTPAEAERAGRGHGSERHAGDGGQMCIGSGDPPTGLRPITDDWQSQ